MNEARFMTLLSAYGAEFARWPEEERAAAELFLDAAPHRVRDFWESERAFDRILARDVDTAPSVLLEGRVLARGPRVMPGRLAGVRGRLSTGLTLGSPLRWAAGGALAASLALGFVVGYSTDTGQAEPGIAEILRISGAGAGAVFESAMVDKP